MGNPRFAGVRHQGFAERLERFTLMAVEQAERNVARPRLVGRHQDFGAADRKGQCTERHAPHKTTPTNVPHGLLLPELCLYYFFNRQWSSGIVASSDTKSRGRKAASGEAAMRLTTDRPTKRKTNGSRRTASNRPDQTRHPQHRPHALGC